MSNWKPSDGMRLADKIVETLVADATATGAVVTPLFRHRMMVVITHALDAGVVAASLEAYQEKSSIFDHAKSATLKALSNGHHPEEHTDDEAIHAADSGQLEAQPKPKKAKPAKAGAKKRGRPSKAEVAARKAAQA